MRSFPPFKEGESLWWKVTNRGKRFIELDLRTEAGAEVFKRMVKDFDVVVENFRPGTLERWGLGPDVLHAINPQLVLLRVTGFGQDGPAARRPGFARLFEAMSGLAHLTGEIDGPPIHPSYPMGDAIGGLFGALSIMTALHSVRSDRAKRGQVVDLSLTEAVFRLLDFQTIAYDQLGQIVRRNGNLNPYSAPSDIYPTRDGKYVSLSGSTNNTFAANLRSIGRTDLAADPRYGSNKLRVENSKEIDAIFRQWFVEHDLAEILAIFSREGGTLAPIYSIDMIFEDEQYKAREAIVSVPDETFGSVRMQGVVPRFSRSPCRVRSSAGRLGQDNDQVLKEYMTPPIADGAEPSNAASTK
jgi:crotonobetainyl-CoA:carnitine CoA-transferase CaiB-like acyl-CoA transferase